MPLTLVKIVGDLRCTVVRLEAFYADHHEDTQNNEDTDYQPNDVSGSNVNGADNALGQGSVDVEN